ncbi:MAG: T9SS type A sorting domain-containing protein, partial [Bacteroidota bacterium]
DAAAKLNFPHTNVCLVLGTDMQTGLFVFDVDYTRASYLEGVASDAGSAAPLFGVDITVSGTSLAEVTGFNGDYATGIADSGNYMVTAAKYGYFSVDTTLLLAPGQVAIWNPALEQAPAVGITVTVEDASTNLPIPNAEVYFELQGVGTTSMADMNGEVNDPSFFAGPWDIFAGKWGYVTNGATINVDSANNNITIQLQPGYYDDATFNFGWQVSGDATEGHWVREVPNATSFFGFVINPDVDVNDDFGSQCFVTGNMPGADVGDDDIDLGSVNLTSPVMDLSNYNNPWLVFDWWFVSVGNFGGGGFRDSLLVNIDNGNTVKTVWAVRDLQEPFWHRDTIKISNHITPTANMRITFRAGDNLFDQNVEAAIDRILVEDQTIANVAEKPETDLLQVFPNPNAGHFTVQYQLPANTAGQFSLYDINGQLISTTALDPAQNQLDIATDVPAGLYLGMLEADGMRLETVKIVRR